MAQTHRLATGSTRAARAEDQGLRVQHTSSVGGGKRAEYLPGNAEEKVQGTAWRTGGEDGTGEPAEERLTTGWGTTHHLHATTHREGG